MARRPPTLSAAARGRQLREAAARFAALAVTIGASQDEASAALEAAWPGVVAGPGAPRGTRLTGP